MQVRDGEKEMYGFDYTAKLAAPTASVRYFENRSVASVDKFRVAERAMLKSQSRVRIAPQIPRQCSSRAKSRAKNYREYARCIDIAISVSAVSLPLLDTRSLGLRVSFKLLLRERARCAIVVRSVVRIP